MKIDRKIGNLNDLLNNVTNLVRTNEDNYCLHLISSIINSGPYIPQTHKSLRPYSMAFIFNEILINQRKNLIEFGGGVSTILIARFIKLNNLKAKLITVEDNKDWSDFIQQLLEKEGLQNIVSLKTSALEKQQDFQENHWYSMSQEILDIGHAAKIDLALIDGPISYSSQNKLSRYFALPFLKNRLSENFVIFLDDANRGGETEILKMWDKELDMKFQIYSGSFAVYYQGSHFSSDPLRYTSVVNVR